MTQPNGEFPDDIADPGVESVLQCRFEAASEYQLGQPITINGTLHNSGSSAVWILSWYTFLDSEWQNCLSVTRNGSPLPYAGVAVFRLVPGRDSYMRIPAGESVSRQIDLGRKYAITEPGDYGVSFNSTIMAALDEGDPDPPSDVEALGRALVESEKVSFRIDGVASTPADSKAEALSLPSRHPTDDLPKVPVDPLYVGLDANQQEQVRRAHWTAYGYLRDALISLDDYEESNNSLYKTFFEQDLWSPEDREGWGSRREIVKATLKKMVEWMTTKDDEGAYEMQDQNTDEICKMDGAIGHADIDQKGAVYLCSCYFNDIFMRLSYQFRPVEHGRAAALLHEIAHAAGGRADIAYNMISCINLARDDPGVAVTNAENYALFVMGRAIDDDLPSRRTYAIKCSVGLNFGFLGWLQSQGNWVTLNGDDPITPPMNKYVKVSWVEAGDKKFLKSSNSERYLGDDGNGGKGDTRTAWNLPPRRTAVEWQEFTGLITIKSNWSQHLCVRTSDKRVFWKSWPLDPQYTTLCCQFLEVTV